MRKPIRFDNLEKSRWYGPHPIPGNLIMKTKHKINKPKQPAKIFAFRSRQPDDPITFDKLLKTPDKGESEFYRLREIERRAKDLFLYESFASRGPSWENIFEALKEAVYNKTT
jgi:hypothetical protein